MEYIYSAMLLHATGQKISEDAVKKVLDAAGAKADNARVKALVAALDGVNIEEAISKTAIMSAAAPVAAAAPAEEKKEKKPKEDEGKKEEEAAAGLGALFG